MNRATPQSRVDDIDRLPSKNKKVTLLERFSVDDITDAAWQKRGELTLWYDSQDRLVSVEVANNDIGSANKEQEFTNMCE